MSQKRTSPNLKHSFKVGDILTIATGEYSDFTYIGPLKVIKDFTTQEVFDLYTGEEPIYETRTDFRGNEYQRQLNEPSPYNFDGWLVKNGYVESMESIEWHVGSYGRFEG